MVHRFIGSGASRDEHPGRAAGQKRRQTRRPVGEDRARLRRRGALRLIGVDADHADTAGPEQPDRELADQAEAHHHHRVARTGGDRTKTLQGDRGERREGGLFVGDRGGHAGREGRIGRDHFGVR